MPDEQTSTLTVLLELKEMEEIVEVVRLLWEQAEAADVSQAQDYCERAKDTGLDMRAALFTIATQAYYDAIKDLSGHTYAEFAHMEFWNTQEEVFTTQEDRLAKLDTFWHGLDPEAQAAFITANIGPSSFADMRVTVPSPVQETAAVHEYTDEELEAMAAQDFNDWTGDFSILTKM